MWFQSCSKNLTASDLTSLVGRQNFIYSDKTLGNQPAIRLGEEQMFKTTYQIVTSSCFVVTVGHYSLLLTSN